MTEATVLWSTGQMRGIAQSHRERIPPRGFAGGFPAGTGRVAVLRHSDVRSALADGRFPDLDLAAAEMLPSICATVLERDDIVLSFGGGGGGLGDPLRRDPNVVGCDVRDARVSAGAAEAIYGVCLRDDGDIDAQATCEARAASDGGGLGTGLRRRVRCRPLIRPATRQSPSRSITPGATGRAPLADKASEPWP